VNNSIFSCIKSDSEGKLVIKLLEENQPAGKTCAKKTGPSARLSQLGSKLDADAEFNFFYPPSAGEGRSLRPFS
jgi:hypothetical protein